MKFQLIYITTALCAIIIFSNCKNDSSAAAKDAAAEAAGAQSPTDAMTIPVDPTDLTTSAPAPATVTTPATPPTEPAQNATGVWHYTWSKGCAGGAGSAIACAKCGTTLTHNTAYHANSNPAPTITPAGAAPAQGATAPKPEPPQNKAGVWHYTCADGCAGGGAAAAPCAKCGKPLAHNQAYHQ